MTAPVVSSIDGDICIVTLNRPDQLNAINPEMVAALDETLRHAGADRNVRAIVLCGAGRAFCVGNDLKGHAANAEDASEPERAEVVRMLQNITRQIVFGEKFVVGAIHGYAVGAGFEWAINCDLAIWADDVKAFCPELDWGLFPTGGITALLPRMTGLIRAREILLLGSELTAPELKELGIAWKIESASQVLDEAVKTARRIAKLPALAVRELKQTFARASVSGLEQTLESEANALARCLVDPEALRRIATFEQKTTASK